MSRPWYYLWGAVSILLLGFFVRVWDLGGASLWVDETVTDFRVQKSVGDTINYLADNASQGPLYYLLLHLFPRSDELQLRMVSVWIAVLGIALFMAFVVQLYSDYDLALIAGILLTVSPYHVWLTKAARAYSLLFTLTLLTSLLFLLLLQGNRSPHVWILYIVSSAAAYVTHHFALLLPLSQYILFGFILRGYRGFFRRWLVAQLLAVIPLGIYFSRVMQQEVVGVGAGWIPQPGIDDLFLTLWNLIVGYDGVLYWYLIPGLFVGLVGLACGAFVAFRDRRTDRTSFYLLLLFITTLGGAFVVSVTLQPFYVDRYFIVCLPSVLLLILMGFERIGTKRLSAIAGGVIGLSSVVSIVFIYGGGLHEREDWRSVARYIDAHYVVGDGLLVEMPNKLIAIRYYLDRDIDYAWLDDGSGIEADLFNQFEAPLNRVWAVYRNPFDDGHRQNAMPDFDPFALDDSPMPDWLNAHSEQIIEYKEFNGVTVLLVDVSNEPYGAK